MFVAAAAAAAAVAAVCQVRMQRTPLKETSHLVAAPHLFSSVGHATSSRRGKKLVMRTLASNRLVERRHRPDRRKDVMAAPDFV